MAEKSELILRVLSCDVFKLGEFVLKSGVSSPIYIDLRRIISYPQVVKDLAAAVRCKQLDENLKTDVICGVPYTALPVASVFSVLYNIPMVMKRKEAKSHGTKKMVEGVFDKGVSCLIVEDIVSSGSSVIETAEALRKEGLTVTDCIVVVNRLQGARENLAREGIMLHSLFDINDIFKNFCSINTVENELVERVKVYLQTNCYIPIKKEQLDVSPFLQRASNCKQPVAKRLFEIIDKKQTNLCVAVDSINPNDLLKLAEELGPHICILKTHIDILKDFNESITSQLCLLASTYNFLIFEDRKFADIGNTVMEQYKSGVFKIQNWADIVTVHGIPGPGIVDALKVAAGEKERACVLIAEMSSKGNLADDNYKAKIVQIAENNPDFVIGYITQQKLSKSENFVHMCPGVSIESSGDSFGQQYKSPEEAIKNGADVIIVGRGICDSSDISSAAITYKTRAFKSYLTRLTK